MHCNRQIYQYSSDKISLNTYINPLTAKIWEEKEGNTPICVLAVCNSERTHHRCRWEQPRHQLMGSQWLICVGPLGDDDRTLNIIIMNLHIEFQKRDSKFGNQPAGPNFEQISLAFHMVRADPC